MIKKLILFIIINQILILSAYACSCDKLHKLKNSDIVDGQVIFIGVVVEVVRLDEITMKTSFRVEENLLDDEQISQTIDIWSIRDCEPHFKENDKWYIFSEKRENKQWSGLCSRSAQLSDRIFEGFVLDKYLRKVKKGFDNSRKRAKREIKFFRKRKADNTR